MTDNTPLQIPVDIDGEVATWVIRRRSSPTDRTWTLELGAPDGRSWSVEAGDVFECLLILRRQLEPESIRVCCNGARVNAWASGMARDMGGGNKVYILKPGQRPTRDDLVPTLQPAPPADVAPTVETQEVFYKSWLRSLQ